MINAVIFDFDGVIVDSFTAWYHAFNNTFEHFGKKKLTKTEFRRKAWAKGMKFVHKEFFPHNSFEEVINYTQSNYHKFLKYIKLIDDPIKIFKILKTKKIKIGLVTNTHKKILTIVLNHLKLNKYFDVIVNADDVKRGKPYPDGLLLYLKKLKVKKNEVLYIGDTKYDKEAAKNANIRFISFRYGKNRINTLSSLSQYL